MLFTSISWVLASKQGQDRIAMNATHVTNASSSQSEPSCPLSSWTQVFKT